MKWKVDRIGWKWGGECLDRLPVVTMGRSSVLSFWPDLGKEWENLKMSRDWECVYRGCQIIRAGNNTSVWLDKHVWACMHVVCPFHALGYINPFFFFSPLLRQNKSWEINTSLPWACLYRTAGVELVNEEEVTLHTPAPQCQELLNHTFRASACVSMSCIRVSLLQILLLTKILG